MLLMTGSHGDKPAMICGLSEVDITQLKAGKHLVIFGDQMYDEQSRLPFPEARIMITYGVTDAHVEQQLRDKGIVDAETRGTSDPVADQLSTALSQNKFILVATVGLPRSGKSTWARAQTYPIVSPDAIRLGLHGTEFIPVAEPFVWAIAQCMVRALFAAGHQVVILDATNITYERRRQWISPDWTTFFKPFPATMDECLSRVGENYELAAVIKKLDAVRDELTMTEKRWPA